MPVPKLEDTIEKYLQSIEHTMNKVGIIYLFNF